MYAVSFTPREVAKNFLSSLKRKPKGIKVALNMRKLLGSFKADRLLGHVSGSLEAQIRNEAQARGVENGKIKVGRLFYVEENGEIRISVVKTSIGMIDVNVKGKICKEPIGPKETTCDRVFGPPVAAFKILTCVLEDSMGLK